MVLQFVGKKPQQSLMLPVRCRAIGLGNWLNKTRESRKRDRMKGGSSSMFPVRFDERRLRLLCGMIVSAQRIHVQRKLDKQVVRHSFLIMREGTHTVVKVTFTLAVHK